MSDRLVVGDEVREAVDRGGAVVALETSVVGQGLPPPRNAECVERMTNAIRAEGAVPAWIGVLDGALRVGLSGAELGRFLEPGVPVKVARRDLPLAAAQMVVGATTVSATIWAAATAGIEVSATGGIGGVHPGEAWDVSADLEALARTPGLLVCSGPKSIVDPERTAARLEELGVVVIGYGTQRLPFFLAPEAPVALDHRVDSADEAAAALVAARDLQLSSTLLVCVPIPGPMAMDPASVAAAAREAEARASAAGVGGKDRTPFLLAQLAEITGGRSLDANLALLEHNATVAARIAVADELRRAG